MTKLERLIRRLVPVALIVATTTAATVQDMGLDPPSQLAGQSLRPYWHVFIAYAIVLVLVMVWAGSIAKRLSDVERRLAE